MSDFEAVDVVPERDDEKDEPEPDLPAAQPEAQPEEEHGESAIDAQFEEYESLYFDEFMRNPEDVTIQKSLIVQVNKLQAYLEERDQHKGSHIHKKLINTIHDQQQNIKGIQISIDRTKMKARQMGKLTKNDKENLKSMEIELENGLADEYNLVTQYKDLIKYELDLELPKGGGVEDAVENPDVPRGGQQAARLQGAAPEASDENVRLADELMQYWFETPEDYITRQKNVPIELIDKREGNLRKYIKNHEFIKGVDADEDNTLDQLLGELADAGPDEVRRSKDKYKEIQEYIKTAHLATREIGELKDLVGKMQPRGVYEHDEYEHLLTAEKGRSYWTNPAVVAEFKDWKDAYHDMNKVRLTIEDNIWMKHAMHQLDGGLSEGNINLFLNMFFKLMEKKASGFGKSYMYLPDDSSLVSDMLVGRFDADDRHIIMTQYRKVADQVNKSNFEISKERPQDEEDDEDDEKAAQVEKEGKPGTYDLIQQLIANGHPEILETLTKQNEVHSRTALANIWYKYWKESAPDADKQRGYPNRYESVKDFKKRLLGKDVFNKYTDAAIDLDLLFDAQNKIVRRLGDAPDNDQTYQPWHVHDNLPQKHYSTIVKALDGHHSDLLRHAIVGTTYANYVARGVVGSDGDMFYPNVSTELAILTGITVPFDKRLERPAETEAAWNELDQLVEQIVNDAHIKNPGQVRDSALMNALFDGRIIQPGFMPTKYHQLDRLIHVVASNINHDKEADLKTVLENFRPITFDLKDKNVRSKFKNAIKPIIDSDRPTAEMMKRFVKLIWAEATRQDAFPPLERFSQLKRVNDMLEPIPTLTHLTDEYDMPHYKIHEDTDLVLSEGPWSILDIIEQGDEEGYNWTKHSVMGKHIDTIMKEFAWEGRSHIWLEDIFQRYVGVLPEQNVPAIKAVLETLMDYYNWGEFHNHDALEPLLKDTVDDQTVYHFGSHLGTVKLFAENKDHFTKKEAKQFLKDHDVYQDYTNPVLNKHVKTWLELGVDRNYFKAETRNGKTVYVLPEADSDEPQVAAQFVEKPKLGQAVETEEETEEEEGDEEEEEGDEETGDEEEERTKPPEVPGSRTSGRAQKQEAWFVNIFLPGVSPAKKTLEFGADIQPKFKEAFPKLHSKARSNIQSIYKIYEDEDWQFEEIIGWEYMKDGSHVYLQRTEEEEEETESAEDSKEDESDEPRYSVEEKKQIKKLPSWRSRYKLAEVWLDKYLANLPPSAKIVKWDDRAVVESFTAAIRGRVGVKLGASMIQMFHDYDYNKTQKWPGGEWSRIPSGIKRDAKAETKIYQDAMNRLPAWRTRKKLMEVWLDKYLDSLPRSVQKVVFRDKVVEDAYNEGLGGRLKGPMTDNVRDFLQDYRDHNTKKWPGDEWVRIRGGLKRKLLAGEVEDAPPPAPEMEEPEPGKRTFGPGHRFEKWIFNTFLPGVDPNQNIINLPDILAAYKVVKPGFRGKINDAIQKITKWYISKGYAAPFREWKKEKLENRKQSPQVLKRVEHLEEAAPVGHRYFEPVETWLVNTFLPGVPLDKQTLNLETDIGPALDEQFPQTYNQPVARMLQRIIKRHEDNNTPFPFPGWEKVRDRLGRGALAYLRRVVPPAAPAQPEAQPAAVLDDADIPAADESSDFNLDTSEDAVILAQPDPALPLAHPAPVVDEEKEDLREQQGWAAFMAAGMARAIGDPIRAIVNRGLNRVQNYFNWNAHTGQIEMRLAAVVLPVVARRRVSRRSRLSDRGRVRFLEQVHSRYHPEDHRKEVARKQSVANDDWTKVHARSQAAQIGEYISLSILPAVLYINIRKGVQLTALRIIVKRIVEHTVGRPTRILLKKSIRTGKYTYKPWLSSKELETMGEDGLFARFMKATNNRRRGISIIVRQNIARGRLQSLWEQKHSLL